jgi:hypothetical protein
MKRKKKVLAPNNPDTAIRVAAKIYISIIILNFIRKWFTIISSIIISGMFLNSYLNKGFFALQDYKLFFVFFILISVINLIFIMLRDSIEPQTSFEKNAVIYASSVLKTKIKIELEELDGKILKLLKKKKGIVDIVVYANNGEGIHLPIKLTKKDLQLLEKNRFVRIRSSYIKLPTFGWCSDHYSISILNEKKKTIYKIESYEPFKTNLKGRKIIG